MKRFLAWLMVVTLVLSVGAVVSAGGDQADHNAGGTVHTNIVARPGGH